MFSFAKPSQAAIRAFTAAQKDLPFPYSEVGQTRGQAPAGYSADHNRVQLGTGRATFERAKSAIRAWKMFEIPGITLCWPGTPITPGATVAVLVSHLGFWSLNACRIVYAIDEREPVETFGFAYGTLPDHAELGEERFSVELRPDDDSVWYDIFAFSRPTALLARLGYPISRALQRRFARESKAAMLRAVCES